MMGDTPVVIFGITPRFKEHETMQGQSVCHFYRESLRDIANIRGLPYIDSFEYLMGLYKSRALARGEISFDGSHYSQEGYDFIADSIFADKFANDDIKFKPGQFKDIAGQWIVTAPSDSAWGGINVHDANVLVIGSSVRLYAYVEDYTNCMLVIHATVDNSASTIQNIVVNNQSVPGASSGYNLSPNLAGVNTFYCNDYPIVTVKLRPGLNNIVLNTTDSARLSGFSVLPIDDDFYTETFLREDEGYAQKFWTSARYDDNPQEIKLVNNDVKVIGNNGNFVNKICDIVPSLFNAANLWRFRATINDATAIYLGQQSNDTINYQYVYKIQFNGISAVTSVRANNGTLFIANTVAFPVASVQDIKIDIRTGNNSWTIWADGVQLFNDSIPLSRCSLFIGNADVTDRVYVNPVLMKGAQSSNTGVLVGEKWHTWSDDKDHVIDTGSTERTITYT